MMNDILTRSYSYRVFRDYNPEDGFTIWLLIELARSRRIGKKARLEICGIFEQVLNRLPDKVSPSGNAVRGSKETTKHWVAGPITELEVLQLKEMQEAS